MMCIDPPAPGKRYVTLMGGLNHTFSRGTIVSLSVGDVFNNTEQHAYSMRQAATLRKSRSLMHTTSRSRSVSTPSVLLVMVIAHAYHINFVV